MFFYSNMPMSLKYYTIIHNYLKKPVGIQINV